MRLSTPHYRAFNVLVFGLFVVVIGGTLATDAPAPVPGQPEWMGWVLLAGAVVMVVRSARLGITVDPERIVVRSWFTTRRIRRADLLGARAAAYDGSSWGRFPWEGWLSQLELTIRGREAPLAVRSILATTRSRRVQRIAYRLWDLRG